MFQDRQVAQPETILGLLLGLGKGGRKWRLSLFSLWSQVFAWGHHWQSLCHHVDINTFTGTRKGGEGTGGSQEKEAKLDDSF